MVSQVPAPVWTGVAIAGGIVLLILLRGRFGRAVLQGLERVQEVCAELAQKGLHPERIIGNETARLGDSKAPLAVAPNTSAATEERAEKSREESTGSEVFMIVTRMLGLLFTLDILLALLLLDGIRTGLVIFQDEGSVGLITLPVSIPTVMGLLGWSMIVLMGSFLLEVVMARWPAGLEFLPPLWREARASRILFRVVVGLGTIGLLCYVVLLGMVAQLQLNHIRWPAAGVLVATLQMLLANLVGLFSLWIVVLGIGAVFAFGCLLVRLVCAILHLLLKSWVTPGKFVVGTRVVPTSDGTAPAPGSDMLWKEGGRWEKPRGALGSGDEGPVPVFPKAETSRYQTSVLAAGEFGRRFLRQTVDVLPSLGGKGSLRVAGYCPTGRLPDRSLGEAIAHAGARDISITPQELTIARHQAGDEGEEVALLLQRQRVKLQEQTPKVAGRELVLVGLDWELIPTAVQPLKQLATALPRHVIVPVIEVPATQLIRPEVRSALETTAMLRFQGVIPCTLVIDRQGPLTQRVVREKQGRLLARSLDGLIVASQQYEENPTGAAVFEELGKHYPFVSLAMGSTALAAGTKLSLVDPGRWAGGSGGNRGRGDVEQTRYSLELLGQDLLEDETACVFPVALDRERRPLFGEIVIPFPQDHRYREICDGLERFAAEEMPEARLVFVSGPGEPDDSVGNHYFGQWSWFYGFTLDELRAESVAPELQTGTDGGPAKRNPGKGTGGNGKTQRRRRTPLRNPNLPPDL